MVNTFPVRSCFEFCSTDKEAPQPCPRGGRRSRVWTFVACAAFGALFTLTSCETTLIDKLYAARNGDPEDMREAIVGIGEVLYSMEQNGVPYNKAALEAVEYLKEIVTSKADPLNRAQALAALASLTRPKVGELFVISLRDRFWLVRYEAARGISTNPSPEMTDPVIEQLHRETQSEVRVELVKALTTLGHDAALETLLALLLDGTGRYDTVKLMVWEGVVEFSGKEFPLEDYGSWKKYSQERFPKTIKGNDGKPSTHSDTAQ